MGEKMKVINKILIANRGEIAVRIIRTCKNMNKVVGIVHSEDDQGSLAVELADEQYLLNGKSLSETYLNIDQIIQIALLNKIDAIHPGYGFLSENAGFAKACEHNKITFIGPSSSVMELMGDKVKSKTLARKANVPILEPTVGTVAELSKKAKAYEYPILVKAVAGGGGKGMRVVSKPEELKDALTGTSREAKNYFGDGRVFIEKYIQNPRHIEVQVLADNVGNVIALFERECTLQRRHQKVIEEAPSPSLSNKKREELLSLAINLTKASQYSNAGTIEFLADEQMNFFFLEMNTRIQVEHPVTEMITGIDIVAEQINIAKGSRLSILQKDLVIQGHAIEARVYAEDPKNNFYPSPGNIHYYHEPAPQVYLRIDSSMNKPGIIRDYFDPMISKVIAHGKDRKEAIKNLDVGLKNYHLHGIKTNLAFLVSLLQNKNFVAHKIDTHFIEGHLPELLHAISKQKHSIPKEVFLSIFLLVMKDVRMGNSVWGEIGYWRIHRLRTIVIENEQFVIEDTQVQGNKLQFTLANSVVASEFTHQKDHKYSIKLKGKLYQGVATINHLNKVYFQIDGHMFILEGKDNLRTKKIFRERNHPSRNFDGNVLAPMPGKVIEVNVRTGETVKPNTKLLVLEAMKMENQISSPINGKVRQINVKRDDRVESGQHLITIELLKTDQANNQKVNDT